MWLYKSKPVKEGRSWKDANGVTHPATWMRWTRKQKESKGLVWKEVYPQASFDERFYNGPAQPKDLNDKPAVDEMNQPVLDDNGQQIITKGLKSLALEKAKQTANALLSPTDWYITRSYEKSTPVPTEITTFRDAVRAASSTIESAINSAADLDAFMLLYKVPMTNGEVTGKAPIENWPDSVV